jgi:hypothetical protein
MNDLTQPSTITLGGIPTGCTNGTFVEQSLVNTYNHWWTMRMTDVQINNVSLNPPPNTNLAISDTGTSLLYFTQTDYSQF